MELRSDHFCFHRSTRHAAYCGSADPNPDDVATLTAAQRIKATSLKMIGSLQIAALTLHVLMMPGTFETGLIAQSKRDMHCDSMQRATMYGYKINKSTPCFDFGDQVYRKSYWDYCLANDRVGRPGCRESNFE